ncbi:MAG: glycosyltransferase N-terminal domain-containing protein [Geminicoccaceae bacterium]|nr:glycosyltransferase N-terminal domain-containing protein [Geminicoccaceae bacterium]
MAERLPPRARHQFLPLDRIPAWRRFFGHWRPDLGVLVESELWPNLFAEARRRSLPLALVNGRMSARSFARWRRLPSLAARLLGLLDLCLAQSEADAERLRRLGARRVEVVGNLKLAAPPLTAEPARLAALEGELHLRPRWLAASTHPGEEAELFGVQSDLLERWPDLLLIVVPRHPERGPAVAEEAGRAGLAAARRSADEPVRGSTRVYVGDTLGELGLFYRLAPVALIGGSLVPHGGQNPLEAARLGCVPVFGPHTQNFADITQALLDRDAAVRVEDARGLAETVGTLLADPERCAACARRAQDAAAAQAEVLESTFAALDRLLDRASACAQS